MVIIPSGKEINRRPSEPPIGAQDAEELRRQHNIAVFRALAMPNQDHAPGAVDVRHSEPRDLRGPEPRRIGRGQCRPALQTRYGFEKQNDLIRAQNHRQFARLARIRDPLRNLRLAECDAVEETKGRRSG
jgi:hypothetical protein